MPELFMIKIGGRPKGRLIEQHDMFFGVGERIGDFIDAINIHWPEVKNAWHLDAYRQVTLVDNHRIKWHPTVAIQENSAEADSAKLKLFFINLGGYLAGEFEEFHHKLLIVAPSQAEAIKQAKNTDFYQQYSFNDKNTPFNAAAHIDDKHRLSIMPLANDELALEKAALLEQTIPAETISEYKSYIGYLSLRKLRKLMESE